MDELGEVVTSLALARVVTELASGRSLSSSRSTLLAVIVLFGQLCWTARRRAGAAIEARWSSVPLSGAVLAAPLGSLIVAGILVGRGKALWRLHSVALLIGGICLASVGRAHGVPEPRTAARLWLLATAHVLACAIDCRLASPHLRRDDFRDALCSALAYVAPAYPLLLLGGSVSLLVVSRLAGIPLERAHGAIDLGSIHLPL